MHFYSFFLSIVVICFSVNLFAKNKSITENALDSTLSYSISQAEYDKLPLYQNSITGEFFIVAKLNQQAIKLLLDTGCNFTNITHQTAQKLKLNIKKSNQNIIGVGGEQQRIFADINCLEILPSIQYKNATLDINKLNSLHFDGILGMDVLQNKGAIIDMNEKAIYFAKDPKKQLAKEDFPKLPFAQMEIKQGVRLLNATINNINVKMLLDTGGQQTLIDIEIAKQAKLKLTALQAQMEGTGANASSLQYTIPEKFNIGDFPLHNLPCLCPDLSQIKTMLGASGMIAGSLLPRLGAIIYIDQNKIFFTRPNAELTDTGIIPGYLPKSITRKNLFQNNPLVCSAKLHRMPEIKKQLPQKNGNDHPQLIINMEYQITEIFQDTTKKYNIGDVLKFPILFSPTTAQWQTEFGIYINHMSLPIIFFDPNQNNGDTIFQANKILLPGSPVRYEQLR